MRVPPKHWLGLAQSLPVWISCRLGLGAYLDELLGAGPPVPAARTLLDLEADEDGRRRSHAQWRAEARDLTTQVWDWLAARRPGPALVEQPHGLPAARTLPARPHRGRRRARPTPNSPSMVQAVRLPGLSLLSIPTDVTPVTVQYLQHELAHLAEHALRPPGAPLAQRWSFDPVRSEGGRCCWSTSYGRPPCCGGSGSSRPRPGR